MAIAEPIDAVPKPKLRWYQFSLRSLLIFCAIIAVFLGGICTHHKLIQYWTLKLWFVFFPSAMLSVAIYGRGSMRAFAIGTVSTFLWITLLLVLGGDEHIREFACSHNPGGVSPYTSFSVIPPPPAESPAPYKPLPMSPEIGETSQPQHTSPPSAPSPVLYNPFDWWDYLYPVLYSLTITIISCFAGLSTVVLRSRVYCSR